MLNKTISLNDIDFRAKARKDLPYLKDKAAEYLDKYVSAKTMEDKIKYIQLHFTYIEIYHATKEELNADSTQGTD